MKKVTAQNGYGIEVPPSLLAVKIYFNQKGLLEQTAEDFYQYHQSRDWKKDRGLAIRNWKVEAANWIWRIQLQG